MIFYVVWSELAYDEISWRPFVFTSIEVSGYNTIKSINTSLVYQFTSQFKFTIFLM
jgi:hypothetical protein